MSQIYRPFALRVKEEAPIPEVKTNLSNESVFNAAVSAAVSRLIAHLVSISIVPSGLYFYFRYSVFPLVCIHGIPAFHVFQFEVPGSHPDIYEINQLQTTP